MQLIFIFQTISEILYKASFYTNFSIKEIIRMFIWQRSLIKFEDRQNSVNIYKFTKIKLNIYIYGRKQNFNILAKTSVFPMFNSIKFKEEITKYNIFFPLNAKEPCLNSVFVKIFLEDFSEKLVFRAMFCLFIFILTLIILQDVKNAIWFFLSLNYLNMFIWNSRLRKRLKYVCNLQNENVLIQYAQMEVY